MIYQKQSSDSSLSGLIIDSMVYCWLEFVMDEKGF